jgi:hypothetical protein
MDHRERQRKCRLAKGVEGNRGTGEERQVVAELAPKTGVVTDKVLKDGPAVAACAVQSAARSKSDVMRRIPQSAGQEVCCICGRRGRWIMPYQEKRRQRE